jgi:chromosome partitioning protein
MVIAIANQKGGVAKSTTALAVASRLANTDKRTLIIDLDPQINASAAIGANLDDTSVYSVITGDDSAANAIQTVEKINIMPGARALSSIDKVIGDQPGREYRLKEAIATVAKKYDFVIIDTPPALGTLTVNALTAADGVVIPACPEAWGLQGIVQLNETIGVIKKYANPRLWVMGILLTRCRILRLMNQMGDMAADVAKNLNTTIYKTKIRECTAIKEAIALHKSIYDHAPRSNGALDYIDFVKELLQQVSTGKKPKKGAKNA